MVRNNVEIKEKGFDGRHIFCVASILRFDGDGNFIVVSQESSGIEEDFLGVEVGREY